MWNGKKGKYIWFVSELKVYISIHNKLTYFWGYTKEYSIVSSGILHKDVSFWKIMKFLTDKIYYKFQLKSYQVGLISSIADIYIINF